MFERLFKIDPNITHSVLLLGPRGTGKTHWLLARFPDAIYIDLLNTSLYLQLHANPTLLEKMIPPGYDGWVIIDEVQKIPELLNEVHRLIEHKKIRFFLTGSSARSLRKKGVNLLAGRALTYTMHPLTALEIGPSFDLSRVLEFGLLPQAVTSSDPALYLETYINTYLKEEILQEGLLRNLGQFSRFLQTASFSQGAMINFSEIAREIGVDRKLVAEYFTILEDLLISVRIPAFTKRAKRRIVSHPKFYLFDAGIYRVIRPQGPLDTPEENDGAGLETVFLQNIRAINDYYRLGLEIYYWRTSTDVEVDFILYGKRGLYAIEIKRKKNLTPKDFNGLRAFLRDYPMAQCYLLYGGDQVLYQDNIKIIPFMQALFELPQLFQA